MKNRILIALGISLLLWLADINDFKGDYLVALIEICIMTSLFFVLMLLFSWTKKLFSKNIG